jgi:transposase
VPPNNKAKIASKRAKEAAARIARRDAALARRKRAIELYESGMLVARICDELCTTRQTIERWIKDAGIVLRRNKKHVREAELANEEERDVFTEQLEETAESLRPADELVAARTDEERALLEVAQNQASPADQYQAYIAANGIKLLRDNLMNVRGPRTIRELNELDQLIRRSLGLDPKGGGKGKGGSLTIDINVLNNTKADLSKHRKIVDVTPLVGGAEDGGDEDDYDEGDE